jgi:hypothetical protein
MASAGDVTKVLAVRIEAEGDGTSVIPEETHFRVKFLVDLLGEAHEESLDQRVPLDTTVAALARDLHHRLASYKGGRVSIVIEALEERYPIDDFYDFLLASVAHSNVDRLERISICCITLLVSRPDVLLQRTRGLQLFAQRLERNGTALFVVADAPGNGDSGPPKRKLVLSQASDRHTDPPTALVEAPQPDAPARNETALRDLVSELLDLEFGHFVIRSGGEDLHVPLLLSCERVARSPECVAALKEELTEFADSAHWLAMGVEFEGAQLDDVLLRQLVDGDASRVIDDQTALEGKHAVIIVDVAYAPARLDAIVKDLERRGAGWVGVFALVGTRDDLGLDARLRSVLELPINSDIGRCELCELNVPAIAGAGIDDVRVHLAEYEPAVFWKLIGLLPSFSEVGHWRSPRTPNHYWLRILMVDVLRSFGTSMARRLIHVLEREARVYVRWIDCIVAADDPESMLLAAKLKEAYHENAPEIVTADRAILRSVSPGELSEEAANWVASQRERLGRRANVIIVDQAAHHLRTYNALKILCDRVGWHTLAFCVVVDRTRIDPEVRQQMHDVHPIALYRWPFPPHLEADCTCTPIS